MADAPFEQEASPVGLVPPVVPEASRADADASAVARRYVAVVSEVPGAAGFAEEQPAVRKTTPRGTDRYATDLPLLVVGALLAGSTFLPWYKGPSGYAVSVSGWTSGTWGPVIFFLGLGSVALIALRRMGVHVNLPVEESLLHEGAGWISLVGAVLKSRLRPGPEGLLSASYGVWIAIAAAAILIVLAGRMAPHAPLVLRPGWHKGKAGVVGIALLGVVVIGSAALGTINHASVQPKQTTIPQVPGRVPNCARVLPKPRDLKPQTGFEAAGECQGQWGSTKPSSQLVNEFRTLLKAKGWKFTEDKKHPGVAIFVITKPRCGQLVILPIDKGSIAAVRLTPCVSPTSSSRPSSGP